MADYKKLLNAAQWALGALKRIIEVSKMVRRPMTFFTLTMICSFGLIWALLPEDESALSIGTALAIGFLAGLNGVICVCVYL